VRRQTTLQEQRQQQPNRKKVFSYISPFENWKQKSATVTLRHDGALHHKHSTLPILLGQRKYSVVPVF
jgi:hypothetical protein